MCRADGEDREALDRTEIAGATSFRTCVSCEVSAGAIKVAHRW